nr:MAG TPA: hypothetical protein [Caudoviricetes sp.]
MFKIKDLNKLKDYGFENRENKRSLRRWVTYQKNIYESDEGAITVSLVVNPYYGTKENELVIMCECEGEKMTNSINDKIMYHFDEIVPLLKDGIIEIE